MENPSVRKAEIYDGFKYLVVRMGYIYRLREHLGSITDKLGDIYRSYPESRIECGASNQLLLTNPDIWGNNMVSYGGKPEEINHIRTSLDEHDFAESIAFRCGSLEYAMHIIKVLLGCKYREDFKITELQKIKVVGDILFMDFY